MVPQHLGIIFVHRLGYDFVDIAPGISGSNDIETIVLAFNRADTLKHYQGCIVIQNAYILRIFLCEVLVRSVEVFDQLLVIKSQTLDLRLHFLFLAGHHEYRRKKDSCQK